jgi:hypothetical protein
MLPIIKGSVLILSLVMTVSDSFTMVSDILKIADAVTISQKRNKDDTLQTWLRVGRGV